MTHDMHIYHDQIILILFYFQNQVPDNGSTEAGDEPPAKKLRGDLCIFCFGVLSPADIEDIASKVGKMHHSPH